MAELNPEFTGLWNRAKLTAIEYLAVFIASVAFVVTIGFSLAGSYLLGEARSEIYSLERDYKELERENRLVQLKIDEYRMALMNAGIDPNPHLDGESK